MNDYPGWDDDSRARYEQRRTLANDEYAQWRDGGGDDAAEDIAVDAGPCADCGRALNDEGLCDECENAAWERQHGPGRV